MFLFRLALELGKTIRELEEEMSMSELMEWVVYLNYVDDLKKGE
jgi:hypothetical protein